MWQDEDASTKETSHDLNVIPEGKSVNPALQSSQADLDVGRPVIESQTQDRRPTSSPYSSDEIVEHDGQSWSSSAADSHVPAKRQDVSSDVDISTIECCFAGFPDA